MPLPALQGFTHELEQLKASPAQYPLSQRPFLGLPAKPQPLVHMPNVLGFLPKMQYYE